jgi:hypothetical protein
MLTGQLSVATIIAVLLVVSPRSNVEPLEQRFDLVAGRPSRQ